MSYRANQPPPAGWVLSSLRPGDTLALLEVDARVPAHVIAAGNGVPWPGKKTCAWGRDVAVWVLSTGGARARVVTGQPNACEPGLGFPMFAPGQRIFLPAGVRVPSTSPPSPPPSRRGIFAVLALLAAAGAALFRGES